MNKDGPDNLSNEVLTYVVSQSRPVRAYEVAEHLGVADVRVNKALHRLAERGLIARVRWGLYSSDLELRKRALLQKLDQLSATTA